MIESYLAAAIQMESGPDKAANLQAAERLIRAAADAGAKLVALPELFNVFGQFDEIIVQAESIPGPTSDWLAALADRLDIFLIAGSIAERDPQSAKAFNTSLLFTPTGAMAARYRKIHLFDIELSAEVKGRESNWIAAGSEVVAVTTEIGVLGLAICYDLRFPELFRKMADASAQVLVVPSAFMRATGQDHWEVLLRARAIENLSYVVAPNQCAAIPGVPSTHGHSAIVDPWGKVLAMAASGARESFVLGRIDLAHEARLRAKLPALANRRLH